MLIERLVSPDERGLFLDRQVAVIFELRHFPRYYEGTERILTDLQAHRHGLQGLGVTRLITESDLTLAHIRRR